MCAALAATLGACGAKEEVVEWSREGSEPKKVIYECRKSDDDTYLLSYNLGTEPRENHAWVIDMENELVTLLH